MDDQPGLLLRPRALVPCLFSFSFFFFAPLVPSLNCPRRATLLGIFGLDQSHYASFARHDRLPQRTPRLGKHPNLEEHIVMRIKF
ncbi:hypothetical protein LZ31DRAFT_548990 [Colletotrichum somersetense]|nr:hypothetical protein LZ31DRAFT_548990 [Colletotrichum somersetense]